MKLTTRDNQPLFKPFEVVITVESQEEAQAVYALFNHTNNTRLFDTKAVDSLREDLKGFKITPSSVIARGVTWSQYYNI